MRTQRIAYAAVVRRRANAVRRPGGPVLARFSPINPYGVPTVFGVLGRAVGADCAPRWYRVQLPMKPNGTKRPDLIGGAVSNGCIRLRNDVLERLFAQVRPGTPVVIRP